MGNWITKMLHIPVSNEIKDAYAIQLWEVRWTSRHGHFSSDIRPEMEAFPTREEAEAFADSLTKAFSLTHNTSSESKVTVQQAR